MPTKDTVLLITPPFTQLNTPYPATAYIKGYLNTIEVPSTQMDLGLDTILAIFSKEGLTNIFLEAEGQELKTESYAHIESISLGGGQTGVSLNLQGLGGIKLSDAIEIAEDI